MLSIAQNVKASVGSFFNREGAAPCRIAPNPHVLSRPLANHCDHRSGERGRGQDRLTFADILSFALVIAAAYALLLTFDSSEAYAASFLSPVAIEKGGVEVAIVIVALLSLSLGYVIGKAQRPVVIEPCDTCQSGRVRL